MKVSTFALLAAAMVGTAATAANAGLIAREGFEQYLPNTTISLSGDAKIIRNGLNGKPGVATGGVIWPAGNEAATGIADYNSFNLDQLLQVDADALTYGTHSTTPQSLNGNQGGLPGWIEMDTSAGGVWDNAGLLSAPGENIGSANGTLYVSYLHQIGGDVSTITPGVNQGFAFLSGGGGRIAG